VAHLELRGLAKRFGAATAVDGVSIAIERGERLALLGPSGCGKTTTLNMIAGFLDPDAGSVTIGGRDMTPVPAHKRNIGMVFQQYALFPHLSVADNVGFGLRMRRVGKAEQARRVAEALAVVRLTGYGERYPRQLSGGQQQRVALARALVLRPEMLLLDEPLSNLDAKLRQEMRTELLQILETVGITTILVTHDQEEALALSQQLVVMNLGRIEQAGPPGEVYRRPASSFVAKFLGDPNVLDARIVEAAPDHLTCELANGWRICAGPRPGLLIGQPVELVLRSERLKLAPTQGGAGNAFAVALEHVIYLGITTRYVVRDGDVRLTVLAHDEAAGRAPGDRLFVQWEPADTLVFPAGGA
jgi:putative spermidine/putrescine transport system ATP-binding protein